MKNWVRQTLTPALRSQGPSGAVGAYESRVPGEVEQAPGRVGPAFSTALPGVEEPREIRPAAATLHLSNDNDKHSDTAPKTPGLGISTH